MTGPVFYFLSALLLYMDFNSLLKNPVRILFIFLIIPVAFISIMLIYSVPLSSDGVQYTDLGRSLFGKGIYDSSFGVAPGWLQPPVFVILVGAFCFIFPFEIAGYVVGILCSILINDSNQLFLSFIINHMRGIFRHRGVQRRY